MIQKAHAIIVIALVVVGIAGWGGSDMAADSATAEDRKAVGEAVDQWFVVLNAMLNGDPGPFAALYSHADDVTYMGAEGSYRVGWEATYADWTAQAAKSSGGTVAPLDVHIVVGRDMATAQHVTKGTVRAPSGEITETVVRETGVFRKEDGVWKMIAHHADGIPFWEKAFETQ